jgi:hypothetical protein
MYNRDIMLQDIQPSPSGLKAFLAHHWLRIVVYFTCLILVAATSGVVAYAHRQIQSTLQLRQTQLDTLTTQEKVLKKYADLKKQVAETQSKGVDATTTAAQYAAILKAITSGDYVGADKLIAAQSAALTVQLTTKVTADAAAEAKRGVLNGTVKEGSTPLASVHIDLVAADNKIAGSVITDASGTYSFKVDAATYLLTVNLPAYIEVHVQNQVVEAQKSTVKDIDMVKVPIPTPTPIPTSAPSTPYPTSQPTANPTSDSTAYSTYNRTTINAQTGSFTADIMTFNLASGHIKVIMDTANDDSCDNNCNVQSVMSFVQQDGGFAGINGTYFCPTSYGASCAGKTNSFYWKQWNSRTQRMINPNNLLGEQDPFIVFDSSGHATYLNRWVDFAGSGIPIYAGISCTPSVVLNGSYSVDESKLDDKQRTAKISRGSIGLKGQTLYVVTVQGATVQDLGYAMQALGVDNAMNTDAGGSSGMVYKNSYKLGPGRAVPNALVLGEQ